MGEAGNRHFRGGVNIGDGKMVKSMIVGVNGYDEVKEIAEN